jgi:hypothetical protein
MEDIKTLLLSDIKEIKMDSITYLDNGIEKVLDLYQCAENYANDCNLNVDENRCVGQRDWFAERPYFIFFDSPKIKFEIVPQKRFIDRFNKYWYQRYYPEFVKVQLELQQFNWHTFDLG